MLMSECALSNRSEVRADLIVGASGRVLWMPHDNGPSRYAGTPPAPSFPPGMGQFSGMMPPGTATERSATKDMNNGCSSCEHLGALVAAAAVLTGIATAQIRQRKEARARAFADALAALRPYHELPTG
jgi:hypothetical protein